MPQTRINKLDAAKRQIDAAIRMLFEREDPVAVHTVVAASFRIVRDLANAHDNIPSIERMNSLIVPGKEKEVWRSMSRFANFLKHADKDPNDIWTDFDEEANDALIYLSIAIYKDLGSSLTLEMSSFVTWFAATNLELLREDAPLKNEIERLGEEVKGFSRSERLSYGNKILQSAKLGPKS